MKIKFRLPAAVLGLMLLLTGATTVKAQDDNVSLQQFYDELSPYGTWIKDADYGYVWRPDVDQAEFRPYYSNGRWVMTEYGNTWVSNYNWGWAPFHYGRWIYDRYDRWVWLPDTVWGPAWVDWRSGGGYYGWAPMGPSLNIHINFGRRYTRPDYCWNFIPQHSIYYSNYPRYRSYNNITIINKTKIINNTYVHNRNTYYTGPRPEEIRRATNQDVKVYNIARNTRSDAPRIENNTVNIYTPRPGRSTSQVQQAPGNPGTYNANGRSENRNGAAGQGHTSTDPRVARGADNSQNRSAAPVGRVADRASEAPSNRNTDVSERPARTDRSAAPATRTEQPAPQNRQAERPPVAQRQDRQMQAPTSERPQQQPSARQQAPAERQAQPQPSARTQAPAPQSRPQESRSGNGNNSRTESSGGGRPARGGR